MNDVSQALRADVLVVGFGNGGATVAATLARHGKHVVLVEESDRMYGGACRNVGCIPSKGLLHLSGRRRKHDDPQDFYENAVRKVQAVRESMRVGSYEGLNGLETASVLTGRAMFTDPHTVVVDTKGSQSVTAMTENFYSVAVTITNGERVTVTADTILINTGSKPVVPDVPGLRDSRFAVTSTELMERSRLPNKLAIIGGGYLGLELAAIYSGFGAEVTVLEAAERLLPSQDADVCEAVCQVLAEQGVEIVTGANLREVRDGTLKATLVYEVDGVEHSLTADAVLPASQYKPATEALGLEAAGVRTDDRGAIELDEHLRTSQPHIFALGDVNGGPEFTYIARDDGRVVLDQLIGAGGRSTADRVAVPRTLFTSPPLATVGMTEGEARRAGHRIKVAREKVADILTMPRAHAVAETRGLMKFVIDADTDQILGAALLSVDSQELINLVVLAMRNGITAGALRDSIYSHPCSTEAFNDVLGVIVHEDPRG
jgi:pyruvate/2-oxoglutarate dehydrogenase complex dihydrolipoamide dehydrogenase (E3) component